MTQLMPMNWLFSVFLVMFLMIMLNFLFYKHEMYKISKNYMFYNLILSWKW